MGVPIRLRGGCQPLEPDLGNASGGKWAENILFQAYLTLPGRECFLIFGKCMGLNQLGRRKI